METCYNVLPKREKNAKKNAKKATKKRKKLRLNCKKSCNVKAKKPNEDTKGNASETQ